MGNTKNYIVWGTYKRLNIQKYLLPIFVSFHPNNTIKYKLYNLNPDKLSSLIDSTKQWFEDLVITSIEEIDKENTDEHIY